MARRTSTRPLASRSRWAVSVATEHVPLSGALVNVTRNDLEESVRKQMTDLLNASLVELIDLQLQAKQAHWNVKGPSFIALHELFDQVAEAVEKAVDTVAERAVALGGVATGTVELVDERSELPPYSLKLKSGLQHVRAL